uniref:DB domain-containing protein n=1 Tax=Strongyloides papillosus TaxID=174720 RepID=A0A0N5BYA7_STREA
MTRFKVFLLIFFFFVIFAVTSINCNDGNTRRRHVDGHHHKGKHSKNETEIKKMTKEEKNKEIKILIGLRKDAEILKKNLNKQTFKILFTKSKKQGKVREEKKENNKLQFLSLWRQKMRNRMKSLMRKINRLEKKIKKMNLKEKNRKEKERKSNTETNIISDDIIKERVKVAGISNESNHNIKKNHRKDKKMHKHVTVNKNINDAKIIENDVKEERLKSFHLSQNISLNGLVGSSCQSHNECKPGLCCHRVKHPRPSDPVAVCVLHDLIDGSPCKHSCACHSGLQCFSPSKNPKIINDQATCKKASTTDFMNGVYENSKETVFDIDQFKFSF